MSNMAKKPIFNHMIDVAFTVEGPWESFDDIPREELIKGLERRIETLKNDDRDAFGYCDTYEV